jgi:hypothetical protein
LVGDETLRLGGGGSNDHDFLTIWPNRDTMVNPNLTVTIPKITILSWSKSGAPFKCGKKTQNSVVPRFP